MEPSADVNDVCVIDGSGLIFVAAEQHRVINYYVPQLGPAPRQPNIHSLTQRSCLLLVVRWCSFLDSLTEELEESGEASLYDDYKFVTRSALLSVIVVNLCLC